MKGTITLNSEEVLSIITASIAMSLVLIEMHPKSKELTKQDKVKLTSTLTLVTILRACTHLNIKFIT